MARVSSFTGLIILGLMVLGASTVMATTISGSAVVGTGLTASSTFNYSGGHFNGSLIFTNSSSTAQGVVAWSLQMFGGGTTISGTGSGAGWTDFYFDHKQSNNGSACDTNSVNGWMCADGFTHGTTPFHLGVVPGHGSLTFTFIGTYSGSSFINQLDLMADGCSTTGYTISSQGTVHCTSNKWAYSAGLPGSAPVPEPGTLALLGSGLLGVGAIIRRKIGL